jgi:hypothetical protein
MIMCGDDPFKKSAMHKNPVSPKSFGASVGPREREREGYVLELHSQEDAGT